MPPAIFLFLTGVTLAFLMFSREQQGLAPAGRIAAAARRAGYLFLLAMAFRLQLWLFGLPNNSWTDLFKVDILNCMGLGILATSVMAAFPSRERARLSAVLGAAIASLSPLVSQLDWSGVHPFLRAYIVPDLNFFGFFPWAAFLAFGVSAGTIIRLTPRDGMARLMQWGCLTGFVLILAAQSVSNMPYSIYERSDFWLDSPGLIFIKLGVILLIASFAYLWMEHGVMDRWSWVRQLGTTSLLVYWVHIELVYGRWFGGLKESLSVAQTVVSAIVLIALMVALSTLRSRWKGLSLRPVLAGYGLSSPRRASGD